jgi:hypothetical protein
MALSSSELPALKFKKMITIKRTKNKSILERANSGVPSLERLPGKLSVRLGSRPPFTTGRCARLLGPEQRTRSYADRVAESCRKKT